MPPRRSLSDLRRDVAGPLAEHRRACEGVRAEREMLGVLRAALDTARSAAECLQTVAQAVQVSAHEQISRVVTRCVRAVGWDYDFRIDFLRKRGRTEARMLFLRGGHPVDPISAAGGGPVDVAALALRLACLALATPKLRMLLILDEPFKSVHGTHYRRRAAELLEVLADEMGVQLIIATGLGWLRVGKVVEL